MSGWATPSMVTSMEKTVSMKAVAGPIRKS